ncbi:MAG: thioredoxin family protein, partial [Candidatus Aenigmarchaeota archaeon]|nr:thioredoxin family protein [Candidatus Aenigmarchaeota archaeon]
MEKNAVALAIAIALIAVSIFVIQGYRSEGPAVQPGIESQGAKAPELQGIAGYINTEGIKLADLRGKVVLIDFWTYTCINCIRTLPYLNAWYDKYHDKGFEIIGVHTPEFSFEKDYNNVKAAVDKYGIRYPVVQDNDYATWRAYKNNYWPRKYLVDAQGNIRYDHIGEGGYE